MAGGVALKLKFWLSFVLIACGPTRPPPCYPPQYRWNYTSFPVLDVQSVSGQVWKAADPGHELDLQQVARAIEATRECVAAVLPLSDAESLQGDCHGTPTTEIRDCLVVEVPPWHISPCSGAQLFSCDVPIQSCLNKGLVPDPKCPCSCRAFIQDNTVLLTTPNLELFPARLTELLTGCDQIWGTRLSICGSSNLAHVR